MAANVELVLGPARCGKTALILSRYRDHLMTAAPGTALWLSPTQRAATHVRESLLSNDLAACLAPGVTTFQGFAERLVASAPRHVRPLDELMKRELIAQLLAEAHASSRLKWFAAIAETEGLVDLFVRFINELKRLEIWPDEFRQACARRSLGPKDREIADIYEAYQSLLQKHDLYDAEGRFWSARDLLDKGHAGAFGSLRLVVVDGFTDFTRTQLEILALLASRVERLFVTLPWESDSGREELFDKTSRTRRSIVEGFAKLESVTLKETVLPSAALGSWPGMEQIERQLFRNPRLIQRSSDARSIHFIAAAQPLDETRQIARRIKLLLTHGDGDREVKPSEIGVAFRSLFQYAPLVQEVFAEYGLPVALEAGGSLAESPPVAALLAFVRLAAEDWPFRELLAAINNSYFTPDWAEFGPTAVRSTRLMLRSLQIPSGRVELLTEAERWSRRAAELAESAKSSEDTEPIQVAVNRAFEVGVALLGRLSATFEQLPTSASPRQWRVAIQRLTDEIGLSRKVRQGSARQRELAALERLLEGLECAETLAERLGREPPRLDLRQVAKLLRLVARSERTPAELDEVGRVRVLAAASARSVSIPYLFISGLSEKSFPAFESDDRLYGEAEIATLAREGLPLPRRSERMREEMLLFYELATRATRGVWFSYPGLDESAQETLPSPFLAEVEQAFEPGAIEVDRASDLRPVPRGEEVLCESERRVLSVARAYFDGQHRLLAGLLRDPELKSLAANLTVGIEAVDARSGREGFSAWEGMLESDEAKRAIAERYGPMRVWSAKDFESYMDCPFKFLMGNVLRHAPPAEISLEVDNIARGNWLHGALHNIHRAINEARSRPSSPAVVALDDYRRMVEESLDKVFAGETEGATPAATLAAIERARLTAWLHGYHAQHGVYDEAMADAKLVPSHFELSFGLKHRGEEPSCRDEPLVIEHGDHTILVGGRIDRVDLGQYEGRNVFVIVDYKSGKSAPHKVDALRNADALQLTIYAMAAEKLLLADRAAMPWQVGYWMPATSGYGSSLPLRPEARRGKTEHEDWESLKVRIAERLLALAQSVRRGEFPVASRDEDCTSRCDFSRVCRINQVRSLEKEWQPSIDLA